MLSTLTETTTAAGVAEEVDLARDLPLHVSTFMAWTAAVAVLTTVIVKKCMSSSENAADDFFLGGRSLGWYVVAGSLMLTNLSTEQLVGLNGTIFKDGCMAGVAWETFAALAMCITATVFLPTYTARGLSTTSGFLGERFDRMTRTLVSVIFLVYYAVVLCPMVLYTGALAIKTVFDVNIPLWIISTVIGVLGSIYALSGGLKAVAVSDCLNGIGLIIFGVWVPVAALSKIGGISTLFQEPDYLKPFATNSQIFDNDSMSRSEGEVSVPWSVLATGLMMNNLYYWATNQMIMQRVLGAQSLAHGQKGVMFAATMKVIGFSFLCLPGVIGMLMVKNKFEVNGRPFEVTKSDMVYPLVVRAVMPTWSLGLFAGVLLGSVLSTFNSALQSASTLFGLEIYAIYIKPEADANSQKKVATIFGIALSLFAYALAPQLSGMDSIFDYLQRLNAITSLPIVSIFVLGLATRVPDAFAAKAGFTVGVLSYAGCQFLDGVEGAPHWLHLYGICFVGAILTMIAATYCTPLRRCFCQAPLPEPFVQKSGGNVVDMTPFRGLYPYCGAITALVVLISVALQAGSESLFLVFWACWGVALVALLFVLQVKAGTKAPAGTKAEPCSDDKSEASSVTV
jgi:SSS family solute:Na+ symporter